MAELETELTKIWRLRDNVNLLWRRLGDDYVVFNEASGQTHVPHELSEWVLREIENKPETMGALVARLCEAADYEEDHAVFRVREVLSELSDLGLIEPDRTVD